MSSGRLKLLGIAIVVLGAAGTALCVSFGCGNGSAPAGPDASADTGVDAMTDAGDDDAAADAGADGSMALDVECQLVESGYGDEGAVQVDTEVVASGLEIPWGIAFLPGGDMLVTERTGDLLRVTPAGAKSVVAEIPIASNGEGGLLGIALHPAFASNRWIYLYYSANGDSEVVNRVARWVLSEDGMGATLDRVVLDNIPARSFHNGGRLRFGPDGHLYIGTGDAGQPSRSQDVNSLAGKVLRVTDEGAIPEDNPFPNSATWIYGVRNTQGFDWLSDQRMVVMDHGPSGELGRSGHDEINVAQRGDNLGWPDIYACEEQEGMVTPSRTWSMAMPPGGAAIYRGTAISEWQGDVLIGVLSFGGVAGHLHRIRLGSDGNVDISETYFLGDEGFGRVREVIMGPDNELYFTTSGCDGRGTCGAGDVIVRVTRNN